MTSLLFLIIYALSGIIVAIGINQEFGRLKPLGNALAAAIWPLSLFALIMANETEA